MFPDKNSGSMKIKNAFLIYSRTTKFHHKNQHVLSFMHMYTPLTRNYDLEIKVSLYYGKIIAYLLQKFNKNIAY